MPREALKEMISELLEELAEHEAKGEEVEALATRDALEMMRRVSDGK